MSRAYQVVIVAVMVSLTWTGCRGREGSLSRRTEDFEVVTEGSADGVTSTIAAPGEAPAPLMATAPPLTDTNADTTTSFTILDTTTTSSTAQPGTLADILTSEAERSQRASRPAPRATPSPQPTEPSEPSPPPQVDEEEQQQEEEEREEEPQEAEPEEREEPQESPPTETSTNPPTNY